MNCVTSGLKKTDPARNEKKREPPAQTAILKIPKNRINPATGRFNETSRNLPSVVSLHFANLCIFR